MNLDDPQVIAAAQEAYADLARASGQRKPWEKLDRNQQRNYLIIGRHIIENYKPRKNDQTVEKTAGN